MPFVVISGIRKDDRKTLFLYYENIDEPFATRSFRDASIIDGGNQDKVRLGIEQLKELGATDVGAFKVVLERLSRYD